MTLDDTVRMLTPAALAFRVDIDGPTFRAYARVLADVPANLAEIGLGSLMASGRVFLPSAPEILVAAEQARRQLLALHPYEGCAECEDQRGYRTVTSQSGQPVVQPCPCKARHRERLESMGLHAVVAQLAGEGTPEAETVYPQLDQLPEHVRQRLSAITAQKVLR